MAEARESGDCRDASLQLCGSYEQTWSEEGETARSSAPSACVANPDEFLPDSRWSASDDAGSDGCPSVAEESTARSGGDSRKSRLSSSSEKLSSPQKPVPSGVAAASNPVFADDASRRGEQHSEANRSSPQAEDTRLLSAPLCVEKALSAKRRLIDERMRELRAQNREREMRRQRQQRLVQQENQRQREEALAARRKRLQQACLWKERGMAAAASLPRKEALRSRVSPQTPESDPASSRANEADSAQAASSRSEASPAEEVWGHLLRERLLRSNSIALSEATSAEAPSASPSAEAEDSKWREAESLTEETPPLAFDPCKRRSASRPFRRSPPRASLSRLCVAESANHSETKTKRHSKVATSSAASALDGGVSSLPRRVSERPLSVGGDSQAAVGTESGGVCAAARILRQLLIERIRQREHRRIRRSVLVDLPSTRVEGPAAPLPPLRKSHSLAESNNASDVPPSAERAQAEARQNLSCYSKTAFSGVARKTRRPLGRILCVGEGEGKQPPKIQREGDDRAPRSVSRVCVNNRRLKSSLLSQLSEHRAESSSVGHASTPQENSRSPGEAQQAESLVEESGDSPVASDTLHAPANKPPSVSADDTPPEAEMPSVPAAEEASAERISKENKEHSLLSSHGSGSGRLGVVTQGEGTEREASAEDASSLASLLAKQAGLEFVRVVPRRASVERLGVQHEGRPLRLSGERGRLSQGQGPSASRGAEAASHALPRPFVSLKGKASAAQSGEREDSLLCSGEESLPARESRSRALPVEAPAPSFHKSGPSRRAKRHDFSSARELLPSQSSFPGNAESTGEDSKLGAVFAALENAVKAEEERLLWLHVSHEALQSEEASRRREEALLRQLSEFLHFKPSNPTSRNSPQRQPAGRQELRGSEAPGFGRLPRDEQQTAESLAEPFLPRQLKSESFAPEGRRARVASGNSSASVQRAQSFSKGTAVRSGASQPNTREGSRLRPASLSLSVSQRKANSFLRPSRGETFEKDNPREAAQGTEGVFNTFNFKARTEGAAHEAASLPLLSSEARRAKNSAARFLVEALCKLQAATTRMSRESSRSGLASGYFETRAKLEEALVQTQAKSLSDGAEILCPKASATAASGPCEREASLRRRNSYSNAARRGRASSFSGAGFSEKQQNRLPRRDPQGAEGLCI